MAQAEDAEILEFARDDWRVCVTLDHSGSRLPRAPRLSRDGKSFCGVVARRGPRRDRSSGSDQGGIPAMRDCPFRRRGRLSRSRTNSYPAVAPQVVADEAKAFMSQCHGSPLPGMSDSSQDAGRQRAGHQPESGQFQLARNSTRLKVRQLRAEGSGRAQAYGRLLITRSAAAI